MKDVFNFSGTFNQEGKNNAIVKIENHVPVPQPTDAAVALWKKELIDLVEKNDIKGVLTALVKRDEDNTIRHQVSQLLARIHKLDSEAILGTITKEEEINELNQIRNGVLLLIDRL